MWQKVLVISFLTITKFRPEKNIASIILLNVIYVKKFHFSKI